MMALEPPDSIGMLNNHFDQYGMFDNEAWGRPREAPTFAEHSTQLIYRYWNLGFRIPPSAGSASGVLPNPVGYNRMYVKLDGPLTVESWYDGVRKGNLFVTNGPMLLVTSSRSGGTLRLAIEASAREPIDRVEMVGDGKVLQTQKPEADSKQLHTTMTVSEKDHSWVAVRCFLKGSMTVRMAHTMPLWLEGRADARDDAAYFVKWIDELIAKSDAEPRSRNVAMYRTARDFYSAKAK